MTNSTQVTSNPNMLDTHQFNRSIKGDRPYHRATTYAKARVFTVKELTPQQQADNDRLMKHLAERVAEKKHLRRNRREKKWETSFVANKGLIPNFEIEVTGLEITKVECQEAIIKLSKDLEVLDSADQNDADVKTRLASARKGSEDTIKKLTETTTKLVKFQAALTKVLEEQAVLSATIVRAGLSSAPWFVTQQ
jgi:hypothetical protein